jgi:uncharacterized membrane protein
LLVHFPLAFLTAAVVADAAALLLHRTDWERIGTFLLVVGVLTAVPTVISGLLAEESAEKIAGIGPHLEQHKTVALITTGLFLALLVARLVTHGRVGPKGGWLYAPLLVVTLALLVVTGHFGARLVFAHGAGTRAAYHTGTP